jgi:hypothetical protein
MKTIKSIFIDTSELPATTSKRTFTVLGDEGSVFTVYITNEDNKFYNFKSGVFETNFAGIQNQVMGSSGQYTNIITFPTITDDDEYNVYLRAETYFDTQLSKKLVNKGFIYKVPNQDLTRNSDGSLTYPSTIYSYLDKNVVVNFSSDNTSVVESNSGALGTITVPAGVFNTTPSLTFSQTASVTANDLSISIDRQPLSSDFYATTTGTVNGVVSSSATVVFDSTLNLQVGFVFYSATGTNTIPATKPTITNINPVTKTITLSAAVSVANDATITFRAYGNNFISSVTGVSFKTEPANTSGALSALLPRVGPGGAFNMSKTLVADFEGGVGNFVELAEVGLKVGNVISATGATDDFSITAITDDQITTNSAGFATNFLIPTGTEVFFQGSANTCTLSGVFTVTSFDKTASSTTTIHLDLDKFLTITDSF